MVRSETGLIFLDKTSIFDLVIKTAQAVCEPCSSLPTARVDVQMVTNKQPHNCYFYLRFYDRYQTVKSMINFGILNVN